MPRDLLDVIQSAARKSVYRPREGVIISVSPVRALVQRVGSFTPISCEYDPSMGVEVGKHCVVDWVQGRRYVITSVFTAFSRVDARDQPEGAMELAPPASITAEGLSTTDILVSWEVPAQLSVNFEVQRNSTPVDAGSISVATTRGNSYIDTSGDAGYFRVRSVTTEWRVSGWSPWVYGEPAGSDFDTNVDQILTDGNGNVLSGGHGYVLIGGS